MLKTFWADHGTPIQADLGGDLPTARGTDPLIDMGGASALQTFYTEPGCPTPEGAETANSISGLPATPQRFQPSETPPGPESLENYGVSTIDRR